MSVIDHLQSYQMRAEQISLSLPSNLQQDFLDLYKEMENFIIEKDSQVANLSVLNSHLQQKILKNEQKQNKLKSLIAEEEMKRKEMIEQEIKHFQQHLEEGKSMWAQQLQEIKSALEAEERSRYNQEAKYKGNLQKINREIDAILFKHKQKFDEPQNLGQILPALFSSNSGTQYMNSKTSLRSSLEFSGPNKDILIGLKRLKERIFKLRNSSSSNESFTSRTMIKKPMLCQTGESLPKKNTQDLVTAFAGILFEFNYKRMTTALNSENLSLATKEKLVFNFINKPVINLQTVERTELLSEKSSNWDELSSVHEQIDTNEIVINNSNMCFVPLKESSNVVLLPEKSTKSPVETNKLPYEIKRNFVSNFMRNCSPDVDNRRVLPTVRAKSVNKSRIQSPRIRIRRFVNMR